MFKYKSVLTGHEACLHECDRCLAPAPAQSLYGHSRNNSFLPFSVDTTTGLSIALPALGLSTLSSLCQLPVFLHCYYLATLDNKVAI